MPTETFQIGSYFRDLSITTIVSIKNCHFEQLCSQCRFHARSKVLHFLWIEAFNWHDCKIRSVGDRFEPEASGEA